MVKLRMTRGLPAPCPHLAERGVGHGLELVVRGGGDPRVGQPHRHHLVQGQRHGGGALGPAGSTHMLGRALQIYRDLAPDSQHPPPASLTVAIRCKQRDSRAADSNLSIIPPSSQLPALCPVLFVLISCRCCHLSQYLHYTVSTQYLHNIYTISTQYLSNIYARNTALRMFAIKILVSKYNMLMEKLRLGTRGSSRPREGEASTRRKSALFRRHTAVPQHIHVRPMPQQDHHHDDLVVQDIELALI